MSKCKPSQDPALAGTSVSVSLERTIVLRVDYDEFVASPHLQGVFQGIIRLSSRDDDEPDASDTNLKTD